MKLLLLVAALSVGSAAFAEPGGYPPCSGKMADKCMETGHWMHKPMGRHHGHHHKHWMKKKG